MSVLPTEIWAKIFRYIDPKHYYMLKRVNRTFYLSVALTFDGILRCGGKGPILSIILKQECSKADFKYILIPSKVDQKYCTYRIDPLSLYGFQGLSKKIQKIIKPILTGSELTGKFPTQLYVELSLFLKKGWDDLKLGLPVNLRAAYQTLFGHIVRTFENLSNKNFKVMESDTQLALLAQAWRVVDILAPRAARDLKLCFESNCCKGCVDFSIEKYEEITKDSPLVIMEDYISIGDETFCQVNTNWEWTVEKGYLKEIDSKINVRDGVELIINSLVHGEGLEFTTIVEMSLKIEKGWLLSLYK